MHIKNEGKKGKTGPIWGWVTVRGGRVNVQAEEKSIWSVDIFLRIGEGRWDRMMEGVNLINMHCKHICKCYNEIPCTINIF
jgi:hypothetical protein